MSRALASPCVGQSSPSSPSSGGLPQGGEKGRSSTRLAEEGPLAMSLFPAKATEPGTGCAKGIPDNPWLLRTALGLTGTVWAHGQEPWSPRCSVCV